MVIHKAERGIFEMVPLEILIIEAFLLVVYTYSIFPVFNQSKFLFVSLLLLYFMGSLFIFYSYVKPCALLRNIGVLTTILLEIMFLFFLFPGLLSRLRGVAVIHFGTATLDSPVSVQLRVALQTALGFILPVISAGYSLFLGGKSK